MIFNVPFIQNTFSRYNNLIFGGRLPRVPIRLTRAFGFVGKCVFPRYNAPADVRRGKGCSMRFSICFDMTEAELEDVVIHEMIHLFIYTQALPQEPSHGPTFLHLMEQLINGKVSGVQIMSNSGSPTSGSTIKIRGGASLNASNDPLIVLDGVPLENGGISGNGSNFLALINPSDIESMTVLKDASSTAIYGSRASKAMARARRKFWLLRASRVRTFSSSDLYAESESQSKSDSRHSLPFL